MFQSEEIPSNVVILYWRSGQERPETVHRRSALDDDTRTPSAVRARSSVRGVLCVLCDAVNFVSSG